MALQRRGIIPVTNTGSSSALGRTFEDRILTEVMPKVAVKLGVSPARLCRVTRHVPHSGDFTVHYRGKIGIVELKNHSRALPLTDRRRFFDSLLVHYKNIDWAILMTSRCSIPRFGEKGYTVVGSLQIDLPGVNKVLPISFICGFDTIAQHSLETVITTLCGPVSTTWPQWKISDLLGRGEATRTLESSWGSGDATALSHPIGALL